MARKAMAKPKAGQPKRKIARPKSAREAEEERVFQEAERLAKLDDDRRKVKTPGSKRAKAVESAEDARIRQVFEQFDTNRGGTLDRKELRNALEALGMEGTRENVRAAMKRYDDDRSRTLDLGEFTQMVRDLLEQQMAIEDAAADAAVAATPGLSPTSAAGSAVKYARAVGRDSPGAY